MENQDSRGLVGSRQSTALQPSLGERHPERTPPCAADWPVQKPRASSPPGPGAPHPPSGLGALGLAEGADDRTSAPWKAVVAARRPGLGPGVREGVRDRANAVIPLAAQGVGCLRRPDGLPGVPARRKRSALTLGRHRRPAQQARKPAQAALARWQAPPHAAPAAPGTPLVGVARPPAGRRWAAAPPRARGL